MADSPVSAFASVQGYDGLAPPPPLTLLMQGTPQSRACDQRAPRHDHGVGRRVMTTASVVALCFFSVCGGAIGSESIFASGGPAMGLIALAIIPFAWSIPIALITAELSTTYPENSGFTVWVHQAFGPFWAFQEGFLSWLSCAVDNALYPALAVTCISKYAPALADTNVGTWFLKAAFAILFGLPNLLGVEMVGRGMVVLTVVVTIPFMIFFVWGFAATNDWSALGQFRHTDTNSTDTTSLTLTGAIDVQWSLLISTTFWSFNGFSYCSTFAGEVANPSVTYPRALLITVVFVELTYLLPLMAAAAYNDPLWSTWTEISFSDIALSLGGDGFLTLITIATLASNWGQYSSEMFSTTFQLTGMAESGLAPALFASRAKANNVPYYSVGMSFLIIFILVGMDFTQVLAMTNMLSSIGQVLLILAAIKLRLSQPDVHRPYRVPGGVGALVAMSIMPITICGYFIVNTFTDNDHTPLYFAMASIAIGIGYALAMKITPKQFVDPKKMILVVDADNDVDLSA
ncbi:Aste57867_17181 [Aphanomyces stellatus]|uniref:Aste57867_17181 protein n=1 Tax=Aphanomyces stellatus TaxID=120398 RepID=A0A485L797_9STRA|nr:hypothetical protein As57867_017122 [Aphanomyces stellatus]VFT93938.1 Aste57867_17181 [Aphanomyces stellatus]